MPQTRKATVHASPTQYPMSAQRADAGPDTPPPASRRVLGMRVDQVEHAEAVESIIAWVTQMPASARVVCAANAHMALLAHDDPAFGEILSRADLVAPDGVPIVWALRGMGLKQRRRVRATPDLVVDLLARCEARGLRVGLYGGTRETLPACRSALAGYFPSLKITYAWDPPFRPLTDAEDAAAVSALRAAGVQLLLVGLGCPKQERWMDAHRDLVPCVMVGVGAAFDLLAGRTSEAPPWMRERGLEWAHRLAEEPRRLGRRYVIGNPRFLLLLVLQLAGRWACGELTAQGCAHRRPPLEPRRRRHGARTSVVHDSRHAGGR